MKSLRTSAIITMQLFLLAQLGSSAQAEEAPSALRVGPAEPSTAAQRSVPDPHLIPEVLSLRPAAETHATTLNALQNQTAVPGIPYQNGFSRSGQEHRVDLATDTLHRKNKAVGQVLSTSGSVASWYGRFVVEGAHAFRVLLKDLVLPPDARIWLYSSETRMGPFGDQLLDPEGNLWLPPMPGPEAVVEIEFLSSDGVPPSTLAFTIGQVMELVPGPGATSLDPLAWTDCDIDALCISESTLDIIDILREAVARLTYVKGGSSYLCTGGLLNDKDPSGFRPYLLTANHCFDTQASASSLVAYFDYRTDSCNGTAPALWNVPSVSGATLLATSPDNDFTFVELSGNPSGLTWYLGWTTASPTMGMAMYRVSHPQGTPQKYSDQSFEGSNGIVCPGLSTTDFHYSATTSGSTSGGSSGSPVTNGDAQVLGQLLGACHVLSWDDCSYSTYSNVDGAFAQTYPEVKEWLEAPGDGDTIGIYRDSDRQWYLRNSNDAGVSDLSFPYGDPSDVPITGDWNGDGVDTPGIYRDNSFYLRNSNSAGFADHVFPFGSPGDVPVAGDWNGDGTDTVGVYRPSNATWYLRNSHSGGTPDLSFGYGLANETPVTGDWNGDGTDTIGIFRASDRSWYLRNSNSAGVSDIAAIPYGDPATDVPVTGDWNGDGTDTIGVYRPGSGEWFLRNSNTAGFADMTFTYGVLNEKPVVGNWDGAP